MFKNKLLIVTIIFVLLEGWIMSRSAHASVTFDRVKYVWDQISNRAGYHIKLYYDNDTYSNAYCSGYAVYITAGMLNDLQTDDQIAMVLGHELGHYVKQHHRKVNSTYNELEADKIGYYYCNKRMGYKKCKTIFVRLKKLYGDKENDGIHPSWSYRLKQLK